MIFCKTTVMALSIITCHPHTQGEGDEGEDLIALEYIGDEYEKSLRPSIADKLQVGFLASDQFTQTVATEILDVKHMTSSVERLQSDLAALKREFEFKKQVLKASFEQRLQNKAFELYGKLNDRLKDLQEIHEERVEVVRRSFKQQLQDALVRMVAYYKTYYDAKLAGKLSSSSNVKEKAIIQNLQQELRQSQTLVQVFQKQVEDLKEELKETKTVEVVHDTSELDGALEQNKALQMEILELSDKNDELQNKISEQMQKIDDLENHLHEAKMTIEQAKDDQKRLSNEMNDARKKLDSERLASMKQLDEQKLALEKNMADRLAMNAERAADSARESQKLLADMEASLEKRMREERGKYERRISELLANNQRQLKQMESAASLERVIEQQKREIALLNQRLGRVQKNWEKKFAIIRASMHALKDEAYIRMQLQKQSASLKYASISYGPDSHSGALSQTVPEQSSHQILPGPAQNKPFLPTTKPLPAITRTGRLLPGKPTISLPSGVGTELFPNEEEEEDDFVPEEGFVPLPHKVPSVGDYMPIANQTG